MTRYKTRTGVVLTQICGEYLLVPAKSLRDQGLNKVQINETAAFCWRVLENGADLALLMQRVAEEYEIEQNAELSEDLKQLLEQLCEHQYLVEEPNSGEEPK